MPRPNALMAAKAWSWMANEALRSGARLMVSPCGSLHRRSQNGKIGEQSRPPAPNRLNRKQGSRGRASPTPIRLAKNQAVSGTERARPALAPALHGKSGLNRETAPSPHGERND